jgi:hypothetical protein
VRPSAIARLRDLVLLVLVAVAGALSAFLFAGWIWFRPLFFTAMGRLHLPLAYGLAAVAVLGGLLYVLAPPPCHAPDARGIKR